MNRQNTNPFEDGPFSSIGRNPFDSSSEERNSSDEDDDDLSYDDEASSVYEDCNTETVEAETDDEHLKNESQLPDDKPLQQHPHLRKEKRKKESYSKWLKYQSRS